MHVQDDSRGMTHSADAPVHRVVTCEVDFTPSVRLSKWAFCRAYSGAVTRTCSAHGVAQETETAQRAQGHVGT